VTNLVSSGTADRSTVQDVLSIYVPSFFIFLGMSIISPILPLYAKTFDVSFTLISLAISMYAFGRFLADLPVGLVADRLGRKPLMVVGTLLLTLTAFMNALARTFWEFLLYRLVQGLGSSMWMTSRTTLLADILKPEERGRIMSYFQAFMLLGSSAGPTIGGFVATRWGIQAPFFFYALTGLISLVLTIIWIKEPKGVRDRHTLDSPLSLKGVRRLLSNSSFSMACLATFTVFFMRTGIRGTMIPLYADGVLGLNESSIGTVISYATIVNLIMTIPVGYAIDYFGRKPPIIVSLIITALSSFVFPMTSNYVQISMATVLLGIGTSGGGQAPLALATDATLDEPHGLSMGLYRLFGDIGFVVGPIILGMIADGYGLKMPFYFMTGLILISAVLLQVFARETYRRRAT
jgi:DHA1 family multidrug resistance protein-like MFS transporter